MPTLYRVTDWDTHFENAGSRKIQDLTWLKKPNKHDGDGYTELVDHPNGAAHYGIWSATIEVASRCQPRGTLLRANGQPHDPASLSRQTRLPEEFFAEALPRFVVIRWLDAEDVATKGFTGDSQAGGSEVVDGCQQGGVEERRREENTGQEKRGESLPPGAGEDEAEEPPVDPYTDDFKAWWKTWPKERRKVKRDAFNAWKAAVNRIRDANAGFEPDDARTHLLALTSQYAQSPKVQQQIRDGEVGFIPYPAKWLAKSYFDDDPETWNQTNARPGHAEVTPGQRHKPADYGQDGTF